MKHRTFLGTNTSAAQCSPLKLRLICVLFILMLATFGLNGPKAQAQTYAEKTLYSFDDNSGGGFFPAAKLISVNGRIYGIAIGGGSSGYGVVFSINADGSGYQTLHSFQGNSDGANPSAGLISAYGILYGTTQDGGSSGCGTIYSMNPDGTGYKTLYSFQGGQYDGDQPLSELLNVNGVLYGTTFDGGSSNAGTIFSINPDGTSFNILYSFQSASSSDGAYPEASLINVNGILYGTTQEGGSLDYGAIYAIDPATNTEVLLHSFTGGKINDDGVDPEASLIAVNGILYGTTKFGGANNLGTVFGINTAGTIYENLHSFTGSGEDGAKPQNNLVAVNGFLVGTTYYGGPMDAGTIFSIDLNTLTQTTNYTFPSRSGDGKLPDSDLININGILYGTTFGGGANSCGTLYCLTPVTIPVAHNDACTVKYNTTRTNSAPGVLANDSTGGDPNCYATLVSLVSHGSLTFNFDGGFSYTPNTGYVGTDSFTYQAVNSAGHSNTATCTLTVIPILPTAKNDACTIAHNKARTNAAPGVLGNDNNGGAAITAALISKPTHGTLTLSNNGAFTYTPNTGYSGTDTFTYQAVNSVGKSNIATVTLTVQ